MDTEYLSDEEFARLNGAEHRISAAAEYKAFVISRISEGRKMNNGDCFAPDGRILRIGRDDGLIRQLELAE